MAFPSTISTFSYPSATDRLNNPSHSALENSQSSAIGQIETFIGTSSSAVGTIQYDVRSPDSNGGGHVQTANKGGTGQTSYTKGDLLVATSSSVLSKFAVSSTAGEVLTIDPNQATGMKWANVVANKVAIVSSTTGISGSGVPVVLGATSILGSILGTNNAVRFTLAISKLSLASARPVEFIGTYGNNTIFDIGGGTAGGAVSDLTGTIEGVIIGNGSDVSQKTITKIILSDSSGNHEASGDAAVGIAKYMGTDYRTSSVVSSAGQNLIITSAFVGSPPNGSIIGQFLVVEKIL